MTKNTFSERQADAKLALTAITALADEPVHVVATLLGGLPEEVAASANATGCGFVSDAMVLDRAICAVTHGGMGATQKALDRGVPVCAVPFGRDQFEVARRVEVARCGTRLPGKKLTPARLREAMTMTEGARRVAAGRPPVASLAAPTSSSSASWILVRAHHAVDWFGDEPAAHRRGTVDIGVATRVHGAAPPFVPLDDIDLASWDFWAQDDDFRGGAFATPRREAPIAFHQELTREGWCPAWGTGR